MAFSHIYEPIDNLSNLLSEIPKQVRSNKLCENPKSILKGTGELIDNTIIGPFLNGVKIDKLIQREKRAEVKEEKEEEEEKEVVEFGARNDFHISKQVLAPFYLDVNSKNGLSSVDNIITKLSINVAMDSYRVNDNSTHNIFTDARTISSFLDFNLYKKETNVIGKSIVSTKGIWIRIDAQRQSRKTRFKLYDYKLLTGDQSKNIYDVIDAPTDIIGDHGLKLESIVRNGLFVKPKIYTYECKNSDGMWVNKYKFKGINNDLVRNNSNCYIELYKGNNVTFDVNRFKKYRGCGVYDVYMTMSINPPDNSKRVMVFDNDGKWVDTEPLIFIDTSDGGTIITVNEWYKLLGDDIYTHNICRKPDIQSPHDNVTTPLIIYENGTVPVIDEQSPEDRRDILRRQHANIIRRKINKLNKQLNALKNEWKKRKKTQKWRRCTRVFSKKGKKKGDVK